MQNSGKLPYCLEGYLHNACLLGPLGESPSWYPYVAISIYCHFINWQMGIPRKQAFCLELQAHKAVSLYISLHLSHFTRFSSFVLFIELLLRGESQGFALARLVPRSWVAKSQPHYAVFNLYSDWFLWSVYPLRNSLHDKMVSKSELDDMVHLKRKTTTFGFSGNTL